MGLLDAFSRDGLMTAMQDPMFQLGVGLLARKEQNFGQALGGAMGDLGRVQQFKEQSVLRKQRAETFKEERERAKKEAEQQAAMQQRVAEFVGQSGDPSMQTAFNLGGAPAALDMYMQQQKPAKLPMSFQEWQLAGSPGSYADWVARKQAASGTSVNVNLPQPLQKGVQSGIQNNIISADLGGDEARRTLQMVQDNPEAVNLFARAFEKGSSVIRGAGDFFGSDTIKQAGEAISPRGAGGATPTQIQASLLATKSAAREIMAPDKGPLTQQEQADYKEALGMLDSADAQVVGAGLENLIGVMDRRSSRLKQISRMSGTAVPGEMNYARPTSAEELKALSPGTEYIAPDGTIRRRK